MAVHPLDELRAAVEAAAADLRNGAAPPRARASLERPKQAGFGDYSTNAAMLLAPALGEPPRQIAERLGERLAARLGDAVERVEVAGPGFLNVFLADPWYVAAAREVLEAGRDWGRSTPEQAHNFNVEFVSANPTGPATAASARHAAYGDALARLFEHTGHRVSREYYFNDAGEQVRKLGASVRARARHEPVPEDGYQGDYVADLAAQIPDAAEADPADLGKRAGALIMAGIRKTLHDYRVDFDTFFLEGSLHEAHPPEPSPIQVALDRLRELGHLYESDGALWLRTTTFGDDKDRVLIKADGSSTYFAADVAYHDDKLRRGFDRLINVLGADHHGYVGRVKASIAALGGDPDAFEAPILQMVHIVEGGEKAKMSKRKGDFVTLDEVIADIGVDATRWFMISRSHETTIDLDLDLARQQNAENPVFYVQYAHARAASILREVGEEWAAESPLELHPAERDLVRRLLDLPAEVAEAAARRAPHRIAGYALDLAQRFTKFYDHCRVKDAEPPELKAFRIGLVVATRDTLAGALGLLGVSAPDSM
ncbi:arginine--tRNA ligase [Candidatus Solirubrobacter pratensis]|uniref:arginine--tRNA ligase n=1 Tax=Candidatus Solirubrobacter pratensis TaxID=1298857 RepID=UPI0004083392